jgi:hypothetical protein
MGTGLEETGAVVVGIMAIFITTISTMAIISSLFPDSAVGVHGGAIPGGGIIRHIITRTTIPITEILITEILIMEVPTHPTATGPTTG